MMLLTKIEPEAFFTVSEQTELFLLSVLAGVTFGVLWDVFRALRVMLPPMRSTALTAVCDALYMIICGLGLYIFSLLFARGEIRAFYGSSLCFSAARASIPSATESRDVPVGPL